VFKNYLKIAIRSLKHNKLYSVINIAGLAVGMACCILILLYVKDELSYDRYHEKADRIYRVFTQEFQNGRWSNDAGTPDLLGPALIKEYPEIEEVVRFFHPSWVDKWAVSVNSRYFYEENLFFADPAIFKVFTFPLILGNPDTSLKEPNSIVLAEEAARKYFGPENPLGKVLVIDNRVEAMVTGVARNVPPNSHFRFDLLVSFESNPEKWALNNWRTHNFYTYLLFQTKPDPREFEYKLAAFVKKHFGDVKDEKLALQPLTDIHLHSKTFEYEMADNNGDASLIYVISAVAAGILLIGCVNFMNLATARSAGRAREVGLRKIVGANRMKLVKQFLGESLVFSFLAALLALPILRAFLPVVNHLTAKNLSLYQNDAVWVGLSLAGLAVLVGFLAGSYPAFFLSAFYPVKVLKGRLGAGLKGALVRKALVAAQFAISLILMIGTLIISNQLRFCQKKDLGFAKENVVVLPLRDMRAKAMFQSLKNELLRHPEIMSVAGSEAVPGISVGTRGMFPEGSSWNPRNSLFVGYDFFKTLDIEMKEGRDFSPDFPSDAEDAYIVNEAAVKDFGWDSPLGKKIIWRGDRNGQGYVIGVVKDFHYRSLHQNIEPLVIQLQPDSSAFVSVRLKTANILGTMSFIKKKWVDVNPGHPFDYFFLDQNYDRLYRSEKRTAELISYFTFLALFVASLGLFGLVSYASEQRTKEIAVRKVLGASIWSVMRLIIQEFVLCILTANLIAWPIAYFAMSRWLRNFAYQTSIGPGTFFLAAASVLFIGLLTISVQTVKAALANPALALRYE
jgi:putative ABC transport system permease protein